MSVWVRTRIQAEGKRMQDRSWPLGGCYEWVEFKSRTTSPEEEMALGREAGGGQGFRTAEKRTEIRK